MQVIELLNDSTELAGITKNYKILFLVRLISMANSFFYKNLNEKLYIYSDKVISNV